MNVPPDDPFIPDVTYRGDYRDFGEAAQGTTGYSAQSILEKTRAALLKVHRGEAAYERDSVTFDHLDLPYPLLALLYRAAAASSGRLSILDFGGSLGSTYYQCRQFLADLPGLEWSIVEQPAHVACGQRDFSDGVLQFYPDIATCERERRPNVLLLSSVLPYLPEPWSFLHAMMSHPGFEWIIVDRTAFLPGARDRLTVETVSPRIYAASYPAWFLSREKFLAAWPAAWRQVCEFDALDRQLLDGVEIIFKGFAYHRSR